MTIITMTLLICFYCNEWPIVEEEYWRRKRRKKRRKREREEGGWKEIGL